MLKCTHPANKDACPHNDQRCCVGCKTGVSNLCKCDDTRKKCQYKVEEKK